ncbi:MAG: hypothetical protein KKF58_01740 [Gammaproteobacteria bacterium]|nr:hypothetical protein [Gammaproteobacteria bacterium]
MQDEFERLDSNNPDFFENLQGLDIDSAGNAAELISSNSEPRNLLCAISYYYNVVIEQSDQHEDFLRDACEKKLTTADGPYAGFLVEAYSDSTGDELPFDDVVSNISFNDLFQFVSSSSSLSDEEIRIFIYRYLDAIQDALEHMGDFGYEVKPCEIPGNLEKDFNAIIIGKMEVIGNLL